MQNLISRQAAIDALMSLTVYKSKREIVQAADKHENSWLGGIAECIDEIEDLPSSHPDLSEYSDKLWRNAYERGKAEAQAEIIRCKDCKHYSHPWYCEAWNNSPGFPAVSDDMFCSMAERRTNERKAEQDADTDAA